MLHAQSLLPNSQGYKLPADSNSQMMDQYSIPRLYRKFLSGNRNATFSVDRLLYQLSLVHIHLASYPRCLPLTS
jgi:hypothetical protein